MVDQVTTIKYLGTQLREDGRADEEIKDTTSAAGRNV